jgi:ABC-type sugar transport system ATPase subunit
VILGVRPGALRLSAEGIPARVYLVEHLGDSTLINFQIGDQIVKMRTDQRPGLREGESVHLSFAPEDAHLFAPETGLRL